MEFTPLNPLELALCDAQAGKSSLKTFLQVFLDNAVVIPSSEEVQDDGRGMSPVCFDKNGVQLMALFTELGRAKSVRNLAQYCFTTSGRELLARMPPGVGLVINPGFSVGFDITPEGIQEILRDFPAKLIDSNE